MQQGMVAKVTDEKYGITKYLATEKGIEFLKDYARLSIHLITKQSLTPARCEA